MLCKIRSELHFVNFKLVLITAVAVLFLGMLTGIFGGGAAKYACLVLPRFAPTTAIFILIWSILYLLIGGCVGYVLGMSRCIGSTLAHRAIFWLSLLIITNLFWYPIFFGLDAFAVAFVVLIIHIIITIYTLKKLSSVSVIVSIVLVVYSVWLFYCLFLNFCIILLNL